MKSYTKYIISQQFENIKYMREKERKLLLYQRGPGEISSVCSSVSRQFVYGPVVMELGLALLG